MKRELGIGRCGLACCLCSENDQCSGCDSGQCPDSNCWNRKCSLKKGIAGCYACKENCRKGLMDKIKPYGFTEYIRRHGEEKLLDCLEQNEAQGVVYHRDGVIGDYDEFEDLDQLMLFIETGKR